MKNKLISITVFLLFFLKTAIAIQIKHELCNTPGFTIGFFNGVWNTRQQAGLSMYQMSRNFFGNTYQNENIKYELFYNQTGSDHPGSTMLEDLAEVFIQRANEIDGSVAKRWELFWEIIQENPKNDDPNFENIKNKITKAIPESAKFFIDLYKEITTKSAAGWSYLLSNPQMEEDYKTHLTRIKTLLLEKNKLLLVAHSQGNLFVNKAYDEAIKIVTPENVNVLHVAPASPTLKGNYVLADLDLVINALRVFGWSSVPQSNVNLPSSHLISDDGSGHKFIETYLNPKRGPYFKFKDLFLSSLTDLKAPVGQTNIGFFTVTLTWDGLGDVDLHIFEPTNSHIYYGNRSGDSGYLDLDNTYGFGPEHYYASCDPSILKTGTYRFAINNFSSATGRMATLQVSSNDQGELLTRSVEVGEEKGGRGNDSPIPVLNVDVSLDENGTYKIKAL